MDFDSRTNRTDGFRGATPYWPVHAAASIGALSLVAVMMLSLAATPACSEDESEPAVGDALPKAEEVAPDITEASEEVPEEDIDPLYSDDLYSDEPYEDGDAYEAGAVGYPDPFEATNRNVFAFNRLVDKWLLDPLTEAYQFVVPKPARHAISRIFLNLSSTKVLVNDLLQLEWGDATITTSRLLLNTTIGLAGTFDVAREMGLERHDSDFGQTLALAGTPSGPYLELPLLGPATVRDGVGTIVDGFFQPTYYILGPADLLIGPTEILLYSGSSGLSLRERHFAELKALEDSSIDFYAALRSGYYQDRIVAIWGRRDDHRTTEEPQLDFDGSDERDD